MSAPPEPNASAPCACTNIALMQLFHELKQKFPGVPDHIVSNTIELYCHDKKACETHLHKEVKASLTHAYHGSSSAAARQLHELKINPPLKCRNQPSHRQEAPKVLTPELVLCPETQTAVYSTDANQNVIEAKLANKEVISAKSPVAVVNLDDCYHNCDEASDNAHSLKDGRVTENTDLSDSLEKNIESNHSTDYKITKSHKVKSNLNEKLKNVKEKKTIGREEAKNTENDKPKRPNTLEFIKPSPDIAFKHKEVGESKPSESEKHHVKDTPQTKLDRGYPLNLSVNVNCHMGYEPWLEQYDSPRAITSVNLTVCTPTSNMDSPVRENRDDEGAFEGHVTVTVSPSTARPPRRRAPPPPPVSKHEGLRPSRPVSNPCTDSAEVSENSIIDRQKERLNRLSKALASEKDKMARLTRETQLLEGPLPSETSVQRLREYVERLRDQCDMLAKRLELGANDNEDSPNFYSNIYTGQRPAGSWQCHMCTFRNHPLLDKCEECDMPRILVGTSPSRTHDSGFGSFRDRSRKVCPGLKYGDVKNSGPCVSNLVGDCRSLPKLNC